MLGLPNLRNRRSNGSSASEGAGGSTSGAGTPKSAVGTLPGRAASAGPTPNGKTKDDQPTVAGGMIRSGASGRIAVRAPSGGARRSFVTRHTAIMIGILVVGVVMLALPLREYLRQRSEINSADQATAEQRARVDALQAKVDQWANDDYVRAQARERLHYLLPGEVSYVVVRPGEENGIPSVPNTGAGSSDLPAGSWYSKLWSSVQRAGKDPKDTSGGPFPHYGQ